MESVELLEKEARKGMNGSESKEGRVAAFLESQTAKIPSDVYLWASLSSMAASLTLRILKKNNLSLFVGQWAPSFLLFGLYNKLVKQLGHD